MIRYSMRFDEVSSTVTYIGKAAVGASETDAVWNITKIEVSGTNTKFLAPAGIDNFNSVWADRASYTYS